MKMFTADWYSVLLEKNITNEKSDSGVMKTIPTRVESSLPEVDWERTWESARVKGLNGDKRSFVLKILYNILPTKARLYRMNLSNSPFCDHCDNGISEDLGHAMIDCIYNRQISD